MQCLLVCLLGYPFGRLDHYWPAERVIVVATATLALAVFAISLFLTA